MNSAWATAVHWDLYGHSYMSGKKSSQNYSKTLNLPPWRDHVHDSNGMQTNTLFKCVLFYFHHVPKQSLTHCCAWPARAVATSTTSDPAPTTTVSRLCTRDPLPLVVSRSSLAGQVDASSRGQVQNSTPLLFFTASADRLSEIFSR